MADTVGLDPGTLVDLVIEREKFENFVRMGMAPADGNFLARNRGGGYVLLTVRSGWSAWQYRATLGEVADAIGQAIDADTPDNHLRRLGPGGSPAKVLRDIQTNAAAALALLREGTTEWDLVADIHKAAAGALTLKPSAPEGSS